MPARSCLGLLLPEGSRARGSVDKASLRLEAPGWAWLQHLAVGLGVWVFLRLGLGRETPPLLLVLWDSPVAASCSSFSTSYSSTSSASFFTTGLGLGRVEVDPAYLRRNRA